MLASSLVFIGLSLVLLWSGVAKIARPTAPDARLLETLPHMRALLPRHIFSWHPWIELAVAVALLAVPAPWVLIATFIAVLLGLGYVMLSASAARLGDADCGCFGGFESKPSATADLVRAAGVLAGAVFCTVAAWWGVSPAAAVAAGEGWWLLAAAVCIGAVGAPGIIRAVQRSPRSAQTGEEQARPGVYTEDGTYLGADLEGQPAPPMPLMTHEPDGGLVDGSRLAQRRPLLLVFVSHDCQFCADAVASFAQDVSWMHRHDVALVGSAAALDQVEVPYARLLVDPFGATKSRLDIAASPAAVLLGTDGTFSGPAFGPQGIYELSVGVPQEE